MPQTPVTFSAWKLTLSIAAGIWLGFIAVALTCLLLYHYLPLGLAPTAATQAPAVAPAPSASNEPMFQQYLERQKSVQEQQNRQIEKTEQEQRFNSAPCQFWRQQYQADPTERNREKMDGYCG